MISRTGSSALSLCIAYGQESDGYAVMYLQCITEIFVYLKTVRKTLFCCCLVLTDFWTLVLNLSNRKRFPCLHSLIETREALAEFQTVMQTRNELEGLHNCREFSLRLECLYQAMQTQERVFYRFYKITFPRKNAKLFVKVLIWREIVTSRKVLYTTSCTRTRNQFLFCKKLLSKIRIFLA